ncbi:hypothetical protein [Saprospira grandis]|uniref:hypothetical protein n=1 Tax=Saprospira grandis TaxID=1008 RepID=UPI0022DD3884|nr:hypothetical protein [Saprospira grandis]WBM73217.1 hypothetical protein OP864_09420 [Saprospira grandis]
MAIVKQGYAIRNCKTAFVKRGMLFAICEPVDQDFNGPFQKLVLQAQRAAGLGA